MPSRKRRFGSAANKYNDDEDELASFEKAPLRGSATSSQQQSNRLPIKRDGVLLRNDAFDGDSSTTSAAKGSPRKRRRSENDSKQQSKESSAHLSARHENNTSSKGSIANLSAHEILRRRTRIQLEMGELCEEILAKPNKAVKQQRSGPSPLDQLLRWCKDPDLEVCRLALISGHIIFSDILPSYRVRVSTEAEMGAQMKKETRLLREFERRLLDTYQRYLKCLGSAVAEMGTKRYNSKSLGKAAVGCLAELLKTRPEFNFRSNIIALLVPLMGVLDDEEGTRASSASASVVAAKRNSFRASIRNTIRNAVEHVFDSDQRGAVSLEIVHLIGKHVKSKNYCAHPDLLRVMFRLRLRVDLKDEGVQRRLKSSAKKKKNKMDDIAKGLAETSGVVDKVAKERNQAKLLEDMFVTYFRVMRKGGAQSPLLQVCMEGVSRFSHLINMELVVDLVEALGSMCRADNLPLEASFQCAIAAMRTLRGPGAALQMDDAEFVLYVYKLLPRLITGGHVASRTKSGGIVAVQDRCMSLALMSLREAFVVRREHSLERTAAFVKRMMTVSAQLIRSEHSLALLSFARLISNRYSRLSQLLDCSEDRVLSNGFLAHVDDPEQCNAMGASLWEAVAITSHYHPTVAAVAEGALKMGTLEPRLQDSNKILKEFSTKAAGFNPGIRPPKDHPQRIREKLALKKKEKKERQKKERISKKAQGKNAKK